MASQTQTQGSLSKKTVKVGILSQPTNKPYIDQPHTKVATIWFGQNPNLNCIFLGSPHTDMNCSNANGTNNRNYVRTPPPLHPSPPILTQFWSGIFWKRKSCFINVIPTVQSFPYYAGTFLQIIGVSSDPVLKKMRSLPDSLQYFFTAQFLYNMFFLSISIFRGTKKKGGRKKGHVSWSSSPWKLDMSFWKYQ